MTTEQKDRIVEAAVKWEKRLDSSMANAWWPETRALQAAVRAAEPKRLRVRFVKGGTAEWTFDGQTVTNNFHGGGSIELLGVESFEVLEP